MVNTIPNHHSEKLDIRPPFPLPWTSLALARIHKVLGAPYAFQVVMDLPYADATIFSRPVPIIIPARERPFVLPRRTSVAFSNCALARNIVSNHASAGNHAESDNNRKNRLYGVVLSPTLPLSPPPPKQHLRTGNRNSDEVFAGLQ